MQDFRYGIAKISEELQKFRNHSENLAIPAQFRYAVIFAMIAKFIMHSEIVPPLILIQMTSFCIILILSPM